MGFMTLLAVLSAPPGASEASAPVSPAEFRAWYDDACASRPSIPAKVKRAAARYQYVFIGGFHNERLPGYFAQNAKELRAQGVPRRAIHFIYPSSELTVAGNCGFVQDEFEAIAAGCPDKLVVIAHSRGACDALAFALRNPEFVSEHIEAFFLVQGPFGGTGVADYLMGEGPAMDGAMPLKLRIIARLLAGAEGFLLDRGKYDGLPALTRQTSLEFWERELKQHAAAIPVVGPKAYFVTSETPPARLRLFRRAIGSYLATYFGPNDGMVALEDQTVPGFGTVLAVLDAGHSELTNHVPFKHGTRKLRRALIDAIIMAVGSDAHGRFISKSSVLRQ
jgi:pimeloyl-ACP methyl ester carboxylesterase